MRKVRTFFYGSFMNPGVLAKADVRDARLRLSHHALGCAVSLLLMICAGSAAVQVRAEGSRAAEPSTRECPDLTGTYEVRIAA